MGCQVSDLQRQVVEVVRSHGYERRDEPFKLASGQTSHDYIDGKRAMDNGARLRLIAEAILELARDRHIDFNAVGGRTMGADPMAHALSILAGCSWFSVRKDPKPRGHERWIEGCRLDSDSRVLLLEDVVTTGGSARLAYDHVVATGASVVGVIPMVDRGDHAQHWFTQHNIPYAPLLTYRDLGIAPVAGPAIG
jgi:orotate phosphoribosyltransferase